MQTTTEFLDSVMKKHGIPSDNQLSIYLGCTRSSISGYRHGKTYFDDDMAFRVAEALEIEPSYVLACVASERARRPEIKAAWKHAADLLFGVAAALAVVAFLPFVDLHDLASQNAAFVGAVAFQNNSLRDVLAEAVYYVKW